MTIGEAMLRLAIALTAFDRFALLLFGVFLGAAAVWVGQAVADRASRRRTVQLPVSDEELLDVSYTAGVVRVGGDR